MKVLITSGGTDVPIDDVRKITNMSSGRYGAEIAEKAHDDGNDVTFFHAHRSICPDAEMLDFELGCDFNTPTYKNFNEYTTVVNLTKELQPDIIILAAAVSDYILDKTEGKISSDGDELIIKLKKAPKILPLIRVAAPDALLVGFKLLVSPTDEEKNKAIRKVFDNGADLVVYNDLTEIRKGYYTRYVYRKDMSYKAAPTVEQLIEIIKNEYSPWSNR